MGNGTDLSLVTALAPEPSALIVQMLNAAKPPAGIESLFGGVGELGAIWGPNGRGTGTLSKKGSARAIGVHHPDAAIDWERRPCK